MFILLIALLLLASPTHGQTSFKVGGVQSTEDTVNVERYDDQNLRKLVGSTTTVPFFHHSAQRFWYSWRDTGGQQQLKVWDAKKGKYPIASTEGFDSYRVPRRMPYGTSPDSLYRLSEDAHGNLCLEHLDTGTKHKLTQDGEQRRKFEITDVQWFGNRFIIYRVDKRKVRRFGMLYYQHTTPTSYDYDYEVPGDTCVATKEFFVGDAVRGTLLAVDTRKWQYQDIQLQHADGVDDRIFIWRKKRTHDKAELCTIDTCGTLRVVITEHQTPIINPDMFQCWVVPGGQDIFLWSDRTGWGHLYHYNGLGKLQGAVTSGNWTAGKIVAVDAANKWLYFYGYGREKGRNPYYAHLYKVGFNGKDLKLLTPENANHHVFVDVNQRLVVDIFSRIDLPPTVLVRNTGGRKLAVLEQTDVSQLHEYGWKEPEMFEVMAADSVTPLYGLMWKPFDFDPSRKYPIISQVYPGPFTETVWTDYTVFDRYHNAALAQRGFIVVVFGHRGCSPYRSKAYYNYGHGNLRDYALADDKAGLEQLAARFPFIDSTRIGIVGHSGGGFMAATALMTYPDFYKVAVASSGNYDNTIYNRNWGEQYQGITENCKFSVPTAQELAPRLKGHLMLVTGDADQNVHPAHTLRLADALIRANKDFELLILPGCTHHYDERDAKYQMYFERRKRDFFEKYLSK